MTIAASTVSCENTKLSTSRTAAPHRTSASAAPSASPSASLTSSQRVANVPGPVSDFAKAIVAASDRTDDDRKTDERRRPGALLTFIGVGAGDRVADLGAGSGYTTELLMRAVGPEGKVSAQNNAYTLERFVSESWPARLKRDAMKDVMRIDRAYETPLPPELTDLDIVTIMFSYHDVVAQGHDVAKMNSAVFAALKPGGHYIIADHNAKAGAGPEVAKELHRLPQAYVQRGVEAAGFKLVGAADFLRDPEDSLDAKSFKLDFKTDRYVLKFVKPDA